MPTRLSTDEARRILKTTFADTSATGDTPVVPAPGAGRKVVVYGFQLFNNVATANNLRFKSAGNNIGPLIGMGANGSASVSPSGVPLFECNANEALNLNLSAATAVGVLVYYTVESV